DTHAGPPAGVAASGWGRAPAPPGKNAAGWPGRGFFPAEGFARPPRHVRLAFVQLAAIRRVGKPDAAVGMRNHVVRRIEALAIEGISDDRYRPVVLVADDPPGQVLAGDLPALKIEGVAVAVVG